MQFIIIGEGFGEGLGCTRCTRSTEIGRYGRGQVLTAIKCIAGAAGGPSSGGNLFVSHASGALNAHLHTDAAHTSDGRTGEQEHICIMHIYSRAWAKKRKRTNAAAAAALAALKFTDIIRGNAAVTQSIGKSVEGISYVACWQQLPAVTHTVTLFLERKKKGVSWHY